MRGIVRWLNFREGLPGLMCLAVLGFSYWYDRVDWIILFVVGVVAGWWEAEVTRSRRTSSHAQ